LNTIENKIICEKMNSHRSSHTHCQAAQSQAQTKACQRVCLFQPKRRISKFFSHALERKKFKTRQNTGNTDSKGK
jgi:hypothetical protein